MKMFDQVRLCIKVDQYDACRTFYEETLDWRIFRQWDRGPQERGVVYYVHESQSLLELEKTGEPPTTLDASFYLFIQVRDVRSLRANLDRKGLHPSEVQSFPWGHTSFVVQDPAGMQLKFFEEGVS